MGSTVTTAVGHSLLAVDVAEKGILTPIDERGSVSPISAVAVARSPVLTQLRKCSQARDADRFLNTSHGRSQK